MNAVLLEKRPEPDVAPEGEEEEAEKAAAHHEPGIVYLEEEEDDLLVMQPPHPRTRFQVSDDANDTAWSRCPLD